MFNNLAIWRNLFDTIPSAKPNLLFMQLLLRLYFPRENSLDDFPVKTLVHAFIGEVCNGLYFFPMLLVCVVKEPVWGLVFFVLFSWFLLQHLLPIVLLLS